jgi:hypothetical protein
VHLVERSWRGESPSATVVVYGPRTRRKTSINCATSRGCSGQPTQPTATARAPQISRIRESASRPRRLTKTATETLSTASKFTAERGGTGSEPVRGQPRWHVPGWSCCIATRTRRSRGIAASRDSTTTGRRLTSADRHSKRIDRHSWAFLDQLRRALYRLSQLVTLQLTVRLLDVVKLSVEVC